MKQYQKKLINYSALASGILSIGVGDAQVIYTDIDPDILLINFGNENDWHEGWKYLDLNYDGYNDAGFKFEFSSYGASGGFNVFVMEMFDENNIGIVVDGPCTFFSSSGSISCYFEPFTVVDVLESGNNINSDQLWGNIDWVRIILECGSYGPNCWMGEFEAGYSAPEEQFMRFQIIDADTNYAWARFLVHDDSVLISDYAFNTTPNEPLVINPPATDVIKSSEILPLIQIFFQNEVITFQADKFLKDVSICIYSIDGKLITEQIVDESRIEIPFVKPPGIFVCIVSSEQHKIYSKVFTNLTK